MIQITVTIVAVVVSPYIMFFSGGFYSYLQKVSSYFSVPVFTIMIVGLLTKRVPAVAAKAGLAFFVTSYISTQFIFPVKMHYLHVLCILFVITTALMLLAGRLWPMKTDFQLTVQSKMNIRPWKRRYIYYSILIMMMIGMFILFSPIGLAKP
ncbi:SLC5/6 family protein [Niabella ginsengisoli]|uniref:Uncharacterized protein n=1 Tax=Niabella ginsengisoli TaxID=522298 RepID=A0ABS9SLF4_9BACT|nr:hypothetical protein [Niabella ginsengisoli]MCH5599126.1 hypothetical protein [Niabella ginsengisoli]